MKSISSVITNLLLAVFVFAAVVVPTKTLAAGALIDCSGGSAGFNDLCDITGGSEGVIIRNAIIAILVVSAVVALIFLIWGGFKWITSGGDKAKVEAARNTIIAAIVGLIVAFLAYFILSIVLGIFNINLGDLKIPTIIP
ncbi:MAG: hypothetical protein KBC15_03600 [Candidatus Levybacteria bacterium]|nr:hypothetical protein [Candidatus Levybacteria bacterium]